MDGYTIFLIHVLGASHEIRQLCLLLVHAINANPQVFFWTLVTLFPVLRQLHAFYSLCSAMIVEKVGVQCCADQTMRTISDLFPIQYSCAIPVSLIVSHFAKDHFQYKISY